jgi:predicted nuclease of predicted toxin-antitoxin system
VWLLDANIDVRIVTILAEFGVESRTAQSLGWKDLSNGDLVSAAVGAGFTCLLTRDALFAESAARALRHFPQFAVVIVRLPQQKWPTYAAAFRSVWPSDPIAPRAGQVIRWPVASR